MTQLFVPLHGAEGLGLGLGDRDADGDGVCLLELALTLLALASALAPAPAPFLVFIAPTYFTLLRAVLIILDLRSFAPVDRARALL